MNPPNPTNPRPVTGFHHAAVRAKDFDASVAFYTNVLGMTPAVGWDMSNSQRAIMLDVGDGNYLEIFERPDAPDTPLSPEPPLLHLALRTETLEATLHAVRDAGMEVTMEPKTIDIQNTSTLGGKPGLIPFFIAFFRGPDGEHIELFQSDLT